MKSIRVNPRNPRPKDRKSIRVNPRNPRPRPVLAVLMGGVSAGTLDILAAFVVYGLRGGRPVRILQSIASGLLGTAAFQGGARTAVLGLALHFSIATSAALVYYLGSRVAPVLARRPMTFGPLYGVAVYVVMNFVVVPLSAVPKRPFSPGLSAIIVVVHMVCVGLPIALAVRRYAGTLRDSDVAAPRSR
jgi:hypothetical protein